MNSKNKKPCPTCGQNIAKRKVMFNKNMVSGLAKAYSHCKLTGSSTFRIGDLQLRAPEYARMNDLVRFGLLYKSSDMKQGVYGLPLERVYQFLSNEWTVAAYFWHNPLNKQNEMSAKRIYCKQVPNIKKLQEQFGVKLTEYGAPGGIRF